VASTINEWARTSGLPIEIREEGIPVREEVRGVSELLGIDPLYLANEGKLLVVCRPEAADRILSAMKTHPLGYEAARIGMVGKNSSRIPVGGVLMKTLMGGTRMVDWLLGDPLPRIC
jgi:hydrogenase expression/formation protein HypE